MKLIRKECIEDGRIVLDNTDQLMKHIDRLKKSNEILTKAITKMSEYLTIKQLDELNEIIAEASNE